MHLMKKVDECLLTLNHKGFDKLKYFSYILNITRNLNQIIKYTAITSNQKIDNNLKLDIDLSLARMLPDNYRTEKHYLSWRKMINKFT